MGVFSWCTSDTRKSIPCVDDAYPGAPQTVYLLNPFGEPYKETAYQGYGQFGGHDVYELLVEWNRPYLSEANLAKPARSQYARGNEGRANYETAVRRYKARCEAIKAFAAGASDEYMHEHFGNVLGFGGGFDWKRCLGIDVGCYEAQQVMLRYPIKIVETPCAYDEAGISPGCPYQGCLYDDTPSAMRQRMAREFDDLEDLAGKYADKQADALNRAFAAMKMDDVYVSETYPHLVVLDEEGNRWQDGGVYEFVLNECLGFEDDGKLQFGFGAVSQELADTLKAHALSYGVKPRLDQPVLEQDLDAQISAAEAQKAPVSEISARDEQTR